MYEELIIATLNHIHMPDIDKSFYKEQVSCYYLKQKISHAFFKNNRKDAQKYYKELRQHDVFDLKSYIKSLITGTMLSQVYMKVRYKDETGKK